MLTQEQVLAAVKAGRKSECIDGRDYVRLCKFFPAEELAAFGMKLNEGVEWKPKEWTREAIIEELRGDIAFGFDKALDRRGLSASSMWAVARMWMWVLDDDLQHDESYAQYGLPLLKKIAVKYGFENPIGDDRGNEDKYSEDG